MKNSFSTKINFLKNRKDIIEETEPSAPSPSEKIMLIKMTKTWCVGGKHYSKTNNIIECQKVNPKTKKRV